MAEEFGGDLTGAVFWGADLSGARFRDVNLTGARISHAWLVDVEVDALVDRLVVNGVDVTAFVNERDEWYPLRAMIRSTTPEGLREAWAALGAEWQATLSGAEGLPDDVRHASVDGEWSLVETIRHLVFAMDKWFTVPVLGGDFHPIGLTNSGSRDFPFPGIDHDASPSFDEARAVREDRSTAFARSLESVTADDLARPVEVLENGTNPVQECVFTVLEEEFWHLRYARRDLARLMT
jgi:hypothetical protein